MNKQIVRRYRYIAQVETTIVFLLCSFVIGGWILQLDMLTKGVIYSAPMHPLAGTICMLGVVAHYLHINQRKPFRIIPYIIGSLIIFLGTIRIIEYLTPLQFDLLYNPFNDENVFRGSRGKFAPVTAMCFVFLGASLIFFRKKIGKKYYPADWFCLITAFISYNRLISYLYGGLEGSSIDQPLDMSYMTAFSLFLLSTAMLLSQGTLEIFKLLSGKYPGSRMARYLLPIALVLPIFTGLIHTYSKQIDLMSDSVNIPLIIIFNVVVMLVLIWKSSLSLNVSSVALEHERLQTERLKEQLRIEESKQLQNYLMEIKIKQQRDLILATIEGQEKEKRKLGMELHDHINQILASTKLYLEIATSDPDPSTSREMVQKSKEQVIDAIREIRHLSHSLIVHEKGTDCVLQNIVTLLNNVREATGIQLHIDITASALTNRCPDIQLGLFRIMQEQFQNVVKHSEATEVWITIEDKPGILYFEISDNGVGFDETANTEGIGIKNIRSRVEAMEGIIELHTAPGAGCRIIIEIPTVCNKPIEEQFPIT